jgi:[LSU ribosomal protein L3P]-glutamine N5-methyltransferase (EC 2.1.1.-)
LGSQPFAAAGLDFSQGQQQPRAEADTLIAWALHLEPEDLAELGAARLLDGEKSTILNYFYQREILRRPTAYITGEAWFAGLRLASMSVSSSRAACWSPLLKRASRPG